MASLDDAIYALFGESPVTELPEGVASLTLSPAFYERVPDLEQAMVAFVSDQAYFDEVTDQALKARVIRNRVESKRRNSHG